MTNHEDKVTWMPITKNGKSVASMEDISPSHKERHEFLRYSLPKGKYDINFVIQLLHIILDQADKNLLSPRDFHFSMKESCKRMLAMLEVEKDNSNLQ